MARPQPGGVIFVATPSLDSWSARLLRERWMEFKAEHLFYFDSATLRVSAGPGRLRGCSHRARPQDAEPGICHPSFPAVPGAGAVAAGPRERAAAADVAKSRQLRVVASGIERAWRGAPPSRRSIERRGRVSVVMPVFNEKSTFSEVIDRLLAKYRESRHRDRHRREQFDGWHA